MVRTKAARDSGVMETRAKSSDLMLSGDASDPGGGKEGQLIFVFVSNCGDVLFFAFLTTEDDGAQAATAPLPSRGLSGST